MKSSPKKVISRVIAVVLLGCSLVFALFSLRVHQQSQRNESTVALSKADDHFINGDVVGAVALVDKARDEAGIGVNDEDRRAKLVACALDYCDYGRKNKALAVLKSFPPSNDKAGKLAARLLTGIQSNDPHYRPEPIPDARAKAQLIALKEQLKNDPAMGQKFVGQYLPKN